MINVPARGFGEATVEMLQEFLQKTGGDGAPLSARLPRCPGLSGAQRKALDEFLGLISDLRRAATTLPVAGLIDRVVQSTGLSRSFADPRRGQKWIARLRQRALLFDGLEDFLAELAVDQPADDLFRDADRITLLTLHAAKGLQFPVVVMIGCEEGILPLQRPGKKTDVEEERRLFYVGMTRAKSRLLLTAARRRRIYGELHRDEPSRFLGYLPAKLVEPITASSPSHRNRKANAAQLSLF